MEATEFFAIFAVVVLIITAVAALLLVIITNAQDGKPHRKPSLNYFADVHVPEEDKDAGQNGQGKV